MKKTTIWCVNKFVLPPRPALPNKIASSGSLPCLLIMTLSKNTCWIEMCLRNIYMHLQWNVPAQCFLGRQPNTKR